MDLEQIQKRIEQLEQAQNDIRVLKDTLEEALKEDDRYQEIDAELRDLGIKKKQIKDEIWGLPAHQEAQAKLKDIREEIKDTQDILNHELLQWREDHKSDEIIGSDGTVRKFKFNVRLQQLRGQ